MEAASRCLRGLAVQSVFLLPAVSLTVRSARQINEVSLVRREPSWCGPFEGAWGGTSKYLLGRSVER